MLPTLWVPQRQIISSRYAYFLIEDFSVQMLFSKISVQVFSPHETQQNG